MSAASTATSNYSAFDAAVEAEVGRRLVALETSLEEALAREAVMLAERKVIIQDLTDRQREVHEVQAQADKLENENLCLLVKLQEQDLLLKHAQGAYRELLSQTFQQTSSADVYAQTLPGPGIPSTYPPPASAHLPGSYFSADYPGLRFFPSPSQCTQFHRAQREIQAIDAQGDKPVGLRDVRNGEGGYYLWQRWNKSELLLRRKMLTKLCVDFEEHLKIKICPKVSDMKPTGSGDESMSGRVLLWSLLVFVWFFSNSACGITIVNNRPNATRICFTLASSTKMLMAAGGATEAVAGLLFDRAASHYPSIQKTILATTGSLGFMTLVDNTLAGGLTQMMERIRP